MQFLEVKGAPESFTSAIGLQEAGKRLDALITENRTLTKVKSRIDVKLERPRMGLITFNIQAEQSQLWFVTATGTLETAHSGGTSVNLRMGLGYKVILSTIVGLIVGLVLLVMGNLLGLLLIAGSVAYPALAYFVEAQKLKELIITTLDGR
jgi:hypothetical protein